MTLPYDIRKKIRRYETLTHTFTKRVGNKTNHNKKTDRRTQSKRRDKKMKVLIKNQNKSNVIQRDRLCDTKKKLEQGSIVNETKINKVKVNVPLINSI